MGQHVELRSEAPAGGKRTRCGKHGFTLVELLLIIAIVGIAGTIAIQPERSAGTSGMLVALFALIDVIGIWAMLANAQFGHSNEQWSETHADLIWGEPTEEQEDGRFGMTPGRTGSTAQGRRDDTRRVARTAPPSLRLKQGAAERASSRTA